MAFILLCFRGILIQIPIDVEFIRMWLKRKGISHRALCVRADIEGRDFRRMLKTGMLDGMDAKIVVKLAQAMDVEKNRLVRGGQFVEDVKNFLIPI